MCGSRLLLLFPGKAPNYGMLSEKFGFQLAFAS